MLYPLSWSNPFAATVGIRGTNSAESSGRNSNHAYSQRVERNGSPRRPSVVADWIPMGKDGCKQRIWHALASAVGYRITQDPKCVPTTSNNPGQ